MRIHFVILRLLLPLLFGFLPGVVEAAPTKVRIGTGVSTDVPKIFSGLLTLFVTWSGVIATTIFLIGAIIMVGSGGDEAHVSAAKKIMKSSLIGLAIILASWMILSTVVSFVAS